MMQHKVFLRLFFLLITTRMAQAQQDPFALRITFGYTDAEVSQWTGRVRDDDARLVSMEGWRFLGPDSISLNTFDIQTSRSLAKGVVLTHSGGYKPRCFLIPTFRFEAGRRSRISGWGRPGRTTSGCGQTDPGFPAR